MVPKTADYRSAIQPGARRSNRLLYARQSTHISEPDMKKSMIPQVYEKELSQLLYVYICMYILDVDFES